MTCLANLCLALAGRYFGVEKVINTSDRFVDWRRHPLCRRYILVVSESQFAHLGGQEHGQPNLMVQWATGFLADGQSELMGVWSTAVMAWPELLEDLQVRGVEDVRYWSSNGLSNTEHFLCSVFPLATLMPLTGRGMRGDLEGVSARDFSAAAEMLESLRTSCTADAARSAVARLRAAPFGAKFQAKVERWEAAVGQSEPFFALAPRLQRFMLAADSVVGRLSRVSRRALTAHGPFVDADSAASFLLEVLGRAERDLARKAVPAVRFGGARWPRVRESSLRGAAL